MFAMVESVNKKNRAPSKALRFLKTPYEALHSRRPNLARDNAWGARVYVTFPPELAAPRTITKLHHPRGYLAHFLCALSDQICLVWRSDTREVKRVTITRVDNSTGFDDVQPHGLHINNRAPLVPPPILDAAYDSDSSSYSKLYNADVVFVSFDGTTDVFSAEIDWSESPEPPRVYEPVDDDRACGPCLRSNYKCAQFSDTNDDPCKQCVRRNRNCNYQTQSNRDYLRRRQQKNARRKEKRKQLKASSLRQPEVSPYFTSASAPTLPSRNALPIAPSTSTASNNVVVPSTPIHATGDDTVIVPSTPVHATGDEDVIVPGTAMCGVDVVIPSTPNPADLSPFAEQTLSQAPEPDRHGATQPIPCTTCLTKKSVCSPGDPGGKCRLCATYRRRCVPSTAEEQQRAIAACRPCVLAGNRLKCIRQSPDAPCDVCISAHSQLNCVPVVPITVPTLPHEDRCVTCQEFGQPSRKVNGGLSAVQCDGARPCNVCVNHHRACVRTEDKDNPPCRACVCEGRTCDLAIPCGRCVKEASIGVFPNEHANPCARFSDNDTTWTAEYFNGDLDAIPMNICSPCSRTGRDCSGLQGQHPCTQCLLVRAREYSRRKVCCMRTGPTTYVAKELAAYSIDEDDEDLVVTYDPEYKGSRLSGKTQSWVSDEFDEGLRDEDMHNLDGLAMSSLCLPHDYSDVRIEGRPDDNCACTVPWYEDLPLDDNLPTLHAFVSTPVLREPRSYKEAMATPQAKDWHKATNTKLDSLLAKDVYKVVPLPHGTKAISSKFVYKAKLTPTSDIAKFKARVVARGFQQRPGIDYNKKFSLTAKSTSI